MSIKELILILISMKLSCSNHVQTLRAQIYMMQSLFHRIQPAQAHVHGFTCQYWHVQTNTCSPFVTNINFFLLSLHILRELRYGPKWCCSVYITPGWGLIKEFSYEVWKIIIFIVHFLLLYKSLLSQDNTFNFYTNNNGGPWLFDFFPP